jgi:hypothetical protein
MPRWKGKRRRLRKMREIGEAELKKRRIKLPKPCGCSGSGGYRYQQYEGTYRMWLLATCGSCRRQKIWNDGVKMWAGLEPDKMVVVNG